MFDGIKKSIEDSKLGYASRTTKETIKQNKQLLIVDLIICYLAAHAIVGFFGSQLAKSNGYIRYVTFGHIVGYGFKHFIVTLIVFAVLYFLSTKLLALFNREGYYDKEKGYSVANDRDIASATRMTDGPEKKRTFKSSKYFEMTDIIYGRDIDHPTNLLTLNEKHYGMNGNIVVIGYPGCGKTRCWVIPILFQLIRKGESVVVTDTKADIYGYVWWVAKLHGVETRFLNFDMDSIRHSDGVDLFSVATKSDEDCTSFAETIISNVAHEETGFWPQAEKNLLTAVMLLVKNDPSRTEKTLAEVRRVLNTSVQNLIAEFNMQRKEGTMLTTCADNWINSSDKVQGDSLSGLSTQLSLLTLPAVGKIVSENEVDLRLPGKKQCIYFVNVNDSKRDLDFVTALFFECLITELKMLADHNPSKTLDVPVTLLFEEFANIGVIPHWNQKMNTLRSRKMQSIMILQCREQLEELYGPAGAESILNACAVHVLLGTNSEKTASFYSRRSGFTSILVQNNSTRGEVQKGSLVKLTHSEAPNITKQKREVYALDEIYRLEHPRELVFVAQHNVCEMERLDRDNHPMTAEVRRIEALHHYPQWVRNLDPIDYDDYGINIEEFKTEEQLLEEAGWDADVDRAYKCKPEDFMQFYHKKEREVVRQNDGESTINDEIDKIDAIREQYGEDITLDQIEEELGDVFQFEDDDSES